MGKKMYYSESEAAEILGISDEELAEYIRDDKVRVFQDGARKMFRTDEIDKLSGKDQGEDQPDQEITEPSASDDTDIVGQEQGEAEAPSADDTADVVSLAEAESTSDEQSKEDTVITAEGISIFDEEDLDIEPADPMAKTQITQSLEDQISLEGVGSGSGLLDLTRESDDTSLGAEVLDNIDIAPSDSLGTSIEQADVESYDPQPVAPIEEQVMVVAEEMDASTGLFSGMIIGGAMVALLMGSVVLAAARDIVPAYLDWFKQNMAVSLLAAIVLVGAASIIGMLLGKAIASSRAAKDTAVS